MFTKYPAVNVDDIDEPSSDFTRSRLCTTRTHNIIEPLRSRTPDDVEQDRNGDINGLVGEYGHVYDLTPTRLPDAPESPRNFKRETHELAALPAGTVVGDDADCLSFEKSQSRRRTRTSSTRIICRSCR